MRSPFNNSNESQPDILREYSYLPEQVNENSPFVSPGADQYQPELEAYESFEAGDVETEEESFVEADEFSEGEAYSFSGEMISDEADIDAEHDHDHEHIEEEALQAEWESGFELENLENGSMLEVELDEEIAANEALERELEAASSATTPVFIEDDTRLPGYTCYVKIHLGKGNYPLDMTGIYVPASFDPQKPADVVIYLHGMLGTFPGGFARIKDYWTLTKLPSYDLRIREEVNASGQNVLLVAPSLGTSPNAYHNDLSGKEGGLDDYMTRVTEAVNTHILQKRFQGSQLNLRHIILSAHSAGGRQMQMIVLKKNPVFGPKVTECWGFDSLYSGVWNWYSWAKKNPDKKLFIYYLSSTQKNSKTLEHASRDLSNVFIKKSTGKNHFWVVKAHLKERLEKLGRTDLTKKDFELIYGPEAELQDFQVGTAVNIYGEKGGGRLTNKKDPPSSDLAYVTSFGKSVPIHKVAKQAWEEMVAAARKEGFNHPLLMPTSGYRSYAKQVELWNAALKKYGSEEAARKWVAKPGGSPHHSGRALDLHLGPKNNSESVPALRKTAVYQWLVKNASRFGFYPYEAEPWHWEHNPLPGWVPGSVPPPSSPSYPPPPATSRYGKAVEANRKYSQSLGWINYHMQINDLLLKAIGQANMSLGEEAFAEALAVWQRQQGFSEKDSDGILGPNTWKRMQPLVMNGNLPSAPPPPVPSGSSIEQSEWTNHPHIRNKYASWQLYKTVRDSVVKWGITQPAGYIESAIQEWNSQPSVQKHFGSFDGDPHRSYLNLKRLYQQKGISNPADYFAKNIVSIAFLNKSTPGHKDLKAKLDAAQLVLKITAPGLTVTNAWSFVPRTFNANINKLSNHALGKAIDIDHQLNPHITSSEEILVIDTCCRPVLPNGLLAETNAQDLSRASRYFQQNFTPSWISSQTRNDVVKAIRNRRRQLDKYAASGFMNLDLSLVQALQNAGLGWGGSWKSAKDFMHFELV